MLGPAIAGGRVVRGSIVGLMHMQDEMGSIRRSLSRWSAHGKAAVALTPDDQRRIGDFFNRYKRHEPGKFSKVPGWGGAVEGVAYVKVTTDFLSSVAT